jgi:tetratricopeptide (TPR) repeat protein
VAYEVWINPVLLRELRVRQIGQLRAEAEEAIAAGNYAQARQALQQLQEILPEDPETNEALRRVEQVEQKTALYNEAKALMATNEWDQAAQVLAELQSLDANYRDLPQLIQEVQKAQGLERQFQAAEDAFAQGDWTTAIARYQAVQQANLTFRFDAVQKRLFQTYLEYGRATLAQAGDDPEQVTEALALFSEALKLRPVDSEALNERRLAELYLTALESENQGEIIELLQTVYSQQPDYAGKAAVQLFYDTLLKQADTFLAAGNVDAAIANCQTAAQLPVDDPSEAQQKLAEITAEASP